MVKTLCIGGADTPWHQFDEYRDSLHEILTELHLDAHFTEDLDACTSENIRDFEIIICCVSERKLKPEQEAGLLAAISGIHPQATGQPKSFFGFHSAATAFPESQPYHQMLGARFLAHPPLKEPFEVHILQPDHPVCAGLEDFSVLDELYLLETYGNFTSLLETQYGEFKCPLAWVKPYGMGKVGYSALGHGKEQLQDANIQRIMRNFILWSMSGKKKSP